MGEILEYLQDRKARLLQKKAFVQTFDMTDLNQQINKINRLITIIENAGE